MVGPKKVRRRLLLPFVALGAVLVAGCAGTPLRDDAELPNWRMGASMPRSVGEVAMAATPRVVDGEAEQRIVVVGGIRGLGSTQDRVYFYDPEADRWEEGPPLPEPRHHTAAASMAGDLHVSGGARSTAGSWDPESDLWRLEADAEEWEELEPMPEGRYGHRLVEHGGALYAVGGHGPGSALFRYSAGEAWSSRAEIPRMRDHLSVVVADGEIWAIGGRADGEGFAQVDVYDPESDAWRDGPDLPSATSGAVEGRIDGEIHIYGGEDPSFRGGGVFDRHWRLDPSAEEPRWVEADPPPQAIHGVEGATLDGHFYKAGGANLQGGRSMFGWSDRLQIREPQTATGAGD